jgi:opacity protein-like surface antigen
VIGIEGDITGTGIKTSSAQNPTCPTTNPVGRCTPPLTTSGSVTSMSQEVNWLASIRGRLGAIWGPGMIYATGGVAWANVDYKANAGDGSFGCRANNFARTRQRATPRKPAGPSAAATRPRSSATGRFVPSTC